jgi:hypothetical protein
MKFVDFVYHFLIKFAFMLRDGDIDYVSDKYT